VLRVTIPELNSVDLVPHNNMVTTIKQWEEPLNTEKQES
jgi:hypothetical protein